MQSTLPENAMRILHQNHGMFCKTMWIITHKPSGHVQHASWRHVLMALLLKASRARVELQLQVRPVDVCCAAPRPPTSPCAGHRCPLLLLPLLLLPLPYILLG